MTVSDDDTWLLASALLNQHGLDAFEEAERRAQKALDDNDEVLHDIWLKVAGAIHELTRTAGTGDAVN